jgi:hypothetical protein
MGFQLQMVLNLRLWLACISVLFFFAGSASAFELSPAVATQAWTWYKIMLGQHPLLTKSVTSSGFMIASDAICQKLTMGAQNPKNDSKPNLDFGRMAQVAITGLTWSGPVTHAWYGLLEKIVKIQDPMLGLFARIILDAIIFSPVTVAGYFTWRSMLEGTGLQGTRHKLRKQFGSTVLGAWKFWPAANIINFGMIPLEYRVLYMNVLSIFWTGYLTLVNANSKRALEEEKKKS